MIKAGILTYHRAVNFGAFLQAYGLCMRLNEEQDIEAEVIDFRMKKEEKYYKAGKNFLWNLRHYPTYHFRTEQNRAFLDALEALPKSEESLLSDDIEEFQEFVKDKYDVIIAGSDELWKLDGVRGFPTPYWLPGNLGCRKFSYAVSSRSDLSSVPQEKIRTIREILNDFAFISVRDKVTEEQITEYVNPSVEVALLPDPSLIYRYKFDGQRGRELLIRRGRLNPDKKIALVMVNHEGVSEQIKKELSDDFQLVSAYTYRRNYKSICLDPFEWLDAIAGADMVFTSFFHGVCFSAVCGTPFLAFAVENKTLKLAEILCASNNGERMLEIDTDLYRQGYLRGKAAQFYRPCNGQEYVAQCRNRFEAFLTALRKA